MKYTRLAALTLTAALSLSACATQAPASSAPATTAASEPTASATPSTTPVTDWEPKPGTATAVDPKTHEALIADLQQAWATLAGEQKNYPVEQRPYALKNATCTLLTSSQMRPLKGTHELDRAKVLTEINAVLAKHKLPAATAVESDPSENFHVRSLGETRMVDLSFAGNGVTSLVEIYDTATTQTCAGA